MSEYLISIYDTEQPYRSYDPEQWGEVFAAHQRFQAQVGELGGRLLSGKAIQPTDTAVSVRDGQFSHGPFVSTPQAFCGYYLIEAADLEKAKQIAASCPAAYGGVET